MPSQLFMVLLVSNIGAEFVRSAYHLHVDKHVDGENYLTMQQQLEKNLDR